MGEPDLERPEAAAEETLDELIRVAVREYGAGTMWFLARDRLGPEHAMVVARALMNGPLDAWRLGRRIRDLACR